MIFDIIFVICLILMVVNGKQKGLVKMGTKLLTALTALVVTALFGDRIKQQISGTDIYLKLYDKIIERLTSQIAEGEGIATKIAGNAIEVIAEKIMGVILSIAVFILVLIAANIVFFILGKIVKAPIIRTFDKAGGMLCAAALTVVIFYFAYSAIEVYAVFNKNEFWQEQREQSYSAKILCEDDFASRLFTEGEKNE